MKKNSKTIVICFEIWKSESITTLFSFPRLLRKNKNLELNKKKLNTQSSNIIGFFELIFYINDQNGTNYTSKDLNVFTNEK